ncbi:3-hydroxyacyl-CoA dehydrogenase NAD-binding domain-containing protein [Sedimentitalea sp. XS_ASV28]|uniref:3-hydroxyacyl-CoA dehydrogenase NAD-binding domain-containing protein n=1 Tax=Sedimentitalea sp. XS_ASV28 TaxID=3241296 RepID=UPI0035184B53
MTDSGGNRTFAILGAGIMGRALARLFAHGGWQVSLIDPNPEALAHNPDHPHIRHCTRLGNATEAAAIIEAVPENLEIKKQVIAGLEHVLPPETPILSNTSGLTLAALTADMAHPGRFLITHFFNPADVIPAVEILPHETTPDTLTRQVCDWLTELGKFPALLTKEVPGFVANRIQHAIMREALSLIEQGVVDAAGLDDIIRWSIGIRLALSGPMKQRDLNGLDTHLAIADYLYPDLAAQDSPSKLLRDKVEQGDLGRKSGRGFYDWTNGDNTAPTDAQLARIIALSREPGEQ